MRITEDCINHNLTKLIDDLTVSPLGFCESADDADHERILTIGYIRGVIDMAKALKEVLKA